MEETVARLIKYITVHACASSAFLSPYLEFTIECGNLIDEIVEIFELDKKEVSEYVDKVQELEKIRGKE